MHRDIALLLRLEVRLSMPELQYNALYCCETVTERIQCGQGDLSAATAHFNGLKTLLSLLGSDIRLPSTLLISMQAYAAFLQILGPALTK